MCGIFGFWLNRPLGEEDIARGCRCVSQLAHRGPDGEGVWIDAARGIFLGHRRLAIIDVDERSAQPMQRADLVITFNGEIYNFEELRGELRGLGEHFKTSGDTEVLLAAWSRWGTSALDRLDAMFAFALFDSDGLTLATDSFGEKPLYVARTSEGVWFSSEPQPLIEELKLKWNPDSEDTKLFLSLGFIPAPRTGVPGLRALPPATTCRYSGPDEEPSEHQYWQLPQRLAGSGVVPQITERDIDDVAGELVTSLRRRLRADVPVGLFLSSGVDSSLIAALCAKELGVQLSTYTVAFPEGVDEAPAAAAIAAHLGLPHFVISGGESGATASAPAALADLFGLPNDNLSGLSVRRMSELARNHVTVALSGSGGDELAFGYNKYAFLWKRRRFFMLPETLIATMSVLDPLLRPIPAWQIARQYLAGDRTFRYLSVKNGGLANLLGTVSGGLPTLNLPKGEPVFSARDYDVASVLPGSYLAAIDRGSMRAGLEVRSPFLSRDVFRAVSKIDPRALVAHGHKELLRRLLLRYIPPALVDNKKRGFVSPLARYVAALNKVPAAPGISEAGVLEVWRGRGNPAAANLLLRIGVLAHFSAAR